VRQHGDRDQSGLKRGEAGSDERFSHGVEPSDPAVGDAVLDGVEDQVPPQAHGLGHLDERRQTGAAGPGAPPVEQFIGLVPAEIAGEDGSNCSFIS